MSEPHLLICPRATSAPVVPDATKRKCVKCGAEVWASPASVIHITVQSKGDWKPLCMDCAARNASAMEFLPMSEGQRTELSAMGLDAGKLHPTMGAREIVEWYRKTRKL